ncbi:hypothetical protein M441DRAFT_264183 [Trichoderma asperellum CBS 433.97]|uniref:Secreted protein n=1 Tax=Trichoderma asperellum (strain ATCC 204424 / CBS 433.97 / NBRC 101777) TaxID=1042311 RepID=A0A2T3YXE3_TRIA4|nr:hypothetical protein M441DRAFT_264183 [Trichoderma asperellum CBS 433.97]PTB37235.1 hypothetical protein M441DRAFT_264183 [Trichoderma asperellum CBS 433.97]
MKNFPFFFATLYICVCVYICLHAVDIVHCTCPPYIHNRTHQLSPLPGPASSSARSLRPCPAHPRLPPSYCFNLSSFRGAAIARRHNLRVRRGFQARDKDTLPSACLLELSIFLCAASYASSSSATAAAASPRPALQSLSKGSPSSCLALTNLFLYYALLATLLLHARLTLIAHLDTTCLRRVPLHPLSSETSNSLFHLRGNARAPLLPRQRPSCHGGRPKP